MQAHLQEVSDRHSHNVTTTQHDCTLSTDGHFIPSQQL